MSAAPRETTTAPSLLPGAAAATEPTLRPAWRRWVLALLLACVAPGVALLAGARFAAEPPDAAALAPGLDASGQLTAMLHAGDRASYLHALLEWSAVCAAAFVALLALHRHRLTGERYLLVLAGASLCSAFADAFHTQVAGRWAEPAAGIERFLPFTWMAGRLLYGSVLVVGIALLRRRLPGAAPVSWRTVAAVGAGIVLTLWLAVELAASSELPTMLYPGALASRPYDLLPLLPVALGAAFVLPGLCIRRPGTIGAR